MLDSVDLTRDQLTGLLDAHLAVVSNRLNVVMKRMTALLEPMAIGIISIVVGFVALSLVLALSSVYEGVV